MTVVICQLPAFRHTFTRLFTTNVIFDRVYMLMGDQQQQEDLQRCWGRVLEGDTQALQSIHAQLYPALHHYAAKLLQSDSDADDAIQEVFVKMWWQRQHIGRIQHVKGFVFTLLRRHALNMLRSRKNSLFHLGQWGSQAPQIAFSPEEIHLHADDNRERQLAVSRALNQLPARQREVLYFRFYETLDYHQIACIMGIRYQSVVNLSYKAMQQLRQWFAQSPPANSSEK